MFRKFFKYQKKKFKSKFWLNSIFWSQIEILVKNRHLVPRSIFWSEIEIFCQNSNFLSKTHNCVFPSCQHTIYYFRFGTVFHCCKNQNKTVERALMSHLLRYCLANNIDAVFFNWDQTYVRFLNFFRLNRAYFEA